LPGGIRDHLALGIDQATKTCDWTPKNTCCSWESHQHTLAL
jgi:hypothetical protein